MCQMEVHEIHHGKGLDCTPVVSRSLDSDHLGVVVGLPPLFPSTDLTRGFAARRLFKVLPCHEGSIHLQTSMSSPQFEPRPYGTAVCVANYCIDGRQALD
ncbi:hypothetical protein TNCV_3593931 [Trichonephila clavipes]|nr:hypothetical protein TNCV_3593931 [Trichonephila clavipes]